MSPQAHASFFEIRGVKGYDAFSGGCLCKLHRFNQIARLLLDLKDGFDKRPSSKGVNNAFLVLVGDSLVVCPCAQDRSERGSDCRGQ